MSNEPTNRSKLTFKALGLLIVGIVGGIVTVFLVIGSILLIVSIFDSPGQGPRTDPMAGVVTLYYIVGGSFAIGTMLSIAAVVVLLRRRRHQGSCDKEREPTGS